MRGDRREVTQASLAKTVERKTQIRVVVLFSIILLICRENILLPHIRDIPSLSINVGILYAKSTKG